MHKTYFRLIILFILLSPAFRSAAQGIQSDNTVAMIRANYLYQFANYNNWPSDTKNGKFYIGILGNTDLYEIASAKYGAKPIGNQTLEFLSLTNLPQATYLHVLFIDKAMKNELPRIVKELKDKSTLIVTNWEGALATGSHINFKNIDGSIRFEINKKSMEDKKITPGIKILQWAIQ
jgi:hypothetical protein